MKTSAPRSSCLALFAVVAFAVHFSGILQTRLFAQDSDVRNLPVAKLVKINDGDLRIFLNSDFFAEYRADWKGTPPKLNATR